MKINGFLQFFLRIKKGILLVLLRLAMFEYHIDSIGKIWI